MAKRRATKASALEPSPEAALRDLREANENLVLAALREQELSEQALRSARLRDHVLAVVSHDVSTPLLSIRLSADTLLSRAAAEYLSERASASLRNIKFAAEQIRALIEDLSDLGQVTSNRIRLLRAPVAVRALVGSVVDLLRPAAADKRIRLKTRFSGGDSSVFCDRHKVSRAIANLVGNAIKFTPDGGMVCVAVRRSSEWIRIRVTDTGPGISQEAHLHLFEPYFRAPENRHQSGLGLGLFISRGLIEAHGGTLSAQKRRGGGAAFVLELPVKPPARD